MNEKFDILSPSGVKLREHILSANCVRKFSLMSEDSITLRFWTREAMDFPVGSYVGDFFITRQQVGKWNAVTGVWDYELVFDAYYWAWANKILRYIIPGIDSAKETSFTLTATIDIHANVIKNCLDFLGMKYNGSPFRIDTTDTTLSSEAKLVRYENLSVLGGIQAIAEAFDCEWWVEENAVYFGRCENNGSKHVFEAGKNTSTISFSQGKTEAPNRIYVYGSDRNLPPNYRKVDGNDTIGGVVVRRLMLPEGIPYLQTEENIPESQIVERVVVLDSVYPKTDLTITEDPDTYTSDASQDDGSTIKETYYRIKYNTDFLFSKSYILPDEELHIVFESGLLNGMDFGLRFNPKGVGEKKDDGSWNPEAQVFEIVANEDYGRKLPDTILKPRKGDKFIIYGWDSTKMADLGLIDSAEKELLSEGEKSLKEYSKDLSSCTCPMAWDYMNPLFENNAQPKPGDVVTIIDTDHFGKGGRKSRIIGYEYKLDKPYAECTYTCGENISVKRLDSIEQKIEGLAKSGSKVQMQNSLDFLSKRYDDRTPYMVASDLGFDVGEFLASVSGGRFGIDKVTGQSFLEVDRIFARVRAYFESLTVVERESLAGEQMVTPGGGVKCVRVEEVFTSDKPAALTGWRCYFLSEQDGEKRETKIKAGDQVIAQTFNAKTGTANKVSNHRWWRLVTGISNNAYIDDSGNVYGYIEVSKSDCETGSDTPKEGDEIVQLGNRNDNTRRAAIIISTVSSDAPSMKLLTGIGSGTTNAEHYSLAGKDIISQGYDSVKGHAYFKCYGDFYVGLPDGSKYIKFDLDNESFDLNNVNLSISSTIGGKKASDFVKDLIPEQDNTLAEEAKKIAEDAQKAAGDAMLEANGAKERLDSWAADGVISPTEKQAIKDEIARIKGEKADLAAQYTKYGSTTPKAYLDAYTAYYNQLVALSAATPENIPIPATFATNQTNYYTQRTVCVKAIADLAAAYADKVSKEEATKATDPFRYLRENLLNAQQESTEISGGLIIATMMGLGYTENGARKLLAGMNGSYNSELGGRTIASWYGGEMLDLFDKYGVRIKNPTGKEATSLTRMDGSGYFANGNFRWETDATLKIGDTDNGYGITLSPAGRILLGSGIEINIGNGAKGLSDTLSSILNWQFGIDNLLIPCDENRKELSWAEATQPDGKGGIKAKSLKAKLGLWSESFVSAHGLNPNGGSGSAFGLLKKWTDPVEETDALSAKLGIELKKRIDSLPTTSANPYGLTIQKNGTDLGTYDGSSAVKVNLAFGWNDITGKPSWIGTSKPGYSFSEISGKPNSLSGYGITDVYTKTEADGKYQVKGNFVTTDTTQEISGQKVSSMTASSWWNGRDNALLRVNKKVLTSYYPLLSIKTPNGSWEVGNRNDERLLFTYVSDANHENKVNTPGTQIKFNSDGVISAYKFVKAGGTSSQFLKADGSVDSNTYLTTGAASSTYVKKSGDTMTGALHINIDSATKHLGFGRASYNYICATAAGGILAFVANGKTPNIANSDLIVENNAVFPGTANVGTLGKSSYRWKNVYATTINVTSKDLVSNLNADLLDGLHSTSFVIDRGGNITGNIYDIATKSIFSGHNLPDAPAKGWVSGLVLGPNWNNNHYQHYLIENGDRWYTAREAKDGAMVNWNTFAYLTDNVASATKLQNSRKLWGRSFDGTEDVDGAMTINYTGETGISLYRKEAGTGAFIRFYNANQTTNYFRMGMYGSGYFGIGYGTTRALTISTANNVGFGTDSPAYRVDVNGAVRVTSLVFGNGDIIISYDAANKGLKISGGGIYSEDYVSAHGCNPNAGTAGGSVFGLYTKWADTPESTDALGALLGKGLYDQQKKNTSAISDLTSKVSNIELGLQDYLKKTDANSKFVTALGTNGNYLTWTKNGAVSNITVPFATAASQLSGNQEHTGTSLSDFTTSFTKTYQATTDLGDGIAYSAILSVSAGNQHRFFQIIGGKSSNFLKWRTTNSSGDAMGEVHWILDDKNYSSILNSVYQPKGDYAAASHSHGQITIHDVRGADRAPNYYGEKILLGWFNNAGTPDTNWWSGIMAKGWTNTYGAWQLCASSHNSAGRDKNLYFRVGLNTAWEAWRKVLDSGNYASVLDGRYYTETEVNNKLASYLPKSSYTASDVLTKLKTVDGDGSGLDADMLDGVHLSSLFRILGNNPDLNALGDGNKQNGVFYVNPGNDTTPFTYGSVLNISNQASSWQLGVSNTKGAEPFFRNRWWSGNGGAWSEWKRLAFTSSNVASATRLKDSFSLWGQTFYGNDVSGSIKSTYFGLNDVNANPYLRLTKDSQNWYVQAYDTKMYLGSGIANGVSIDTNGHVAIGRGSTNPAYMLDVNGVISASGEIRTTDVIRGYRYNTKKAGAAFIFDKPGPNWTGIGSANGTTQQAIRLGSCSEDGTWVNGVDNEWWFYGTVWAKTGIWCDSYISARGQNTSSDERLKHVLRPLYLDVRAIANAPSVEFVWKKDGVKDVGSIAQYWKKLIPQLAPDMPDGSMGLQYGKTALMGLISVAKKTVSLEERVSALERENKELKRKLITK